MQTQEVEIKPNIKVFMRSDSEMLDEVMVVAYGTAKKSAFTGSASVIKSETLEKRQVSNLSNALSGTVSGVQTQSTNGQPGTSATVRIRGIGSMYASNNPLYVVDGIPYEGDISAVNSQDIESMTVLKDAAAAALYGARGANGVILVTTKKGKSGDTQISLDARWGVNSRLVKNYDVLQNANTYMETAYSALYNGYLYNSGYTAEQAYQLANADLFPKLGYQVYTIPDGQYLIGRNGKLNPHAALGYSDGDYYYTPDNWSDEMFQSNLRQEYNLSVSGGSDKLSYYLSASYLNDEGIIENSGFERISTRMNVDYQAKKWLKLGVNLSYSNVTSRSPGDQDTDAATSSGNAFFVGNFIAPIYPMYVRNADGSLQYNANTGYHVYDYGDGSSTNFTRNFMSMSNPMSGFLYDTEKYLMDILNGKWYAKIDIIDGLSLTASLGLHIDNTRQHSVGNKYYGQSASYGGSVMQYSSRVYSLDQQYLLNYKKTFGNHNLDILAGYESMDFNTESHYILGYNMYSDKNWTASNVIDRKNGSGSYNEYATIGIITRASYDFNEKYYGSVSYRRDASSVFHPDYRWGNFWSVGASWRLKEENFLKDVEWLDNLKFKVSYGSQGNDYLLLNGVRNRYAYMDQFSVSNNNGQPAITQTYKGNDKLKWETNYNFNTGIEFSVLNGRLSGGFEFFSRYAKDLLFNRPLAASTGSNSYPDNIGDMRNTGFEVELSGDIIRTSKINWNISVNATTYKNKILTLPEEKRESGIWNGIFKMVEGGSYYDYYIKEWAGVDPEDGKAMWYKDVTDKNGNTTKETTKTYSEATDYKAGCALPDLYGGISTSLNAYGFDFSIALTYQLGGQGYDYTYATLMNSAQGAGTNYHNDILNAWTPENKYTDVPKLNAKESNNNSTSTRFLTSTSYLSLQNISVGYTLPKNWIAKLGCESLRVYFVADNVALLSARKGYDPRTNWNGESNYNYSALRSISGGITMKF